MIELFKQIVSGAVLPLEAREQLLVDGFTVIRGPVAAEHLAGFSAAYDAAMESADPADVSIGRASTRVSGFVNRGPEFDAVYLYPPLLEASHVIIGQPFKLSTMHARTLRPHSSVEGLHVDMERDASGWPLTSFILMVDEFRADNGATRFVPGSHRSPIPPDNGGDRIDSYSNEVLACGPAGSMIVFNGSVWHSHTANRSAGPRRSIQGAYIRRDCESAANMRVRMKPETLARIGPLAKYLIDI